MKSVATIILSFITAFACFSCTSDKLTRYAEYYPAKTVSTATTSSITVNSVFRAAPQIEAESTHEAKASTVFITSTGKKYHFSDKCAGENATAIDFSEVESIGKEPCKRCVK